MNRKHGQQILTPDIFATNVTLRSGGILTEVRQLFTVQYFLNKWLFVICKTILHRQYNAKHMHNKKSVYCGAPAFLNHYTVSLV
jgi:hypothetical protein